MSFLIYKDFQKFIYFRPHAASCIPRTKGQQGWSCEDLHQSQAQGCGLACQSLRKNIQGLRSSLQPWSLWQRQGGQQGQRPKHWRRARKGQWSWTMTFCKRIWMLVWQSVNGYISFEKTLQYSAVSAKSADTGHLNEATHFHLFLFSCYFDIRFCLPF